MGLGLTRKQGVNVPRGDLMLWAGSETYSDISSAECTDIMLGNEPPSLARRGKGNNNSKINGRHQTRRVFHPFKRGWIESYPRWLGVRRSWLRLKKQGDAQQKCPSRILGNIKIIYYTRGDANCRCLLTIFNVQAHRRVLNLWLY